MKQHHLGYACRDINKGIDQIRSIFNILEVSQTVYDPLQNATVCLITLEDSSRIELVTGECVKNMLSDTPLQYYHTCYEVSCIDTAIKQFTDNGSFIISDKKPAKLFNNCYAAFVQTPLGIIELIETNSDQIKINCLVNATFNLAPIKNILTEQTLFPNNNVQFTIANYNTLLLDLTHPESALYSNQYRIHIIMIRLIDLVRFHNKTNVNDTIAAHCNLIISRAKNLNPENQYYFIITPSATNNEIDLMDEAMPSLESLLVEELNTLDYCQAIVLDTSTLDSAQLNEHTLNDETHIPYKDLMYRILGHMTLGCIYQHDASAQHKLVVVDCDNTLWTGVCAEDDCRLTLEAHNLQLQNLLVSLYQRGFLIALSSKNLQQDVLNTFKILEMPLKIQHICDHEINFDKKSDNIKKLCKRLDIAVNSVIFIDDNPTEVAEVSCTLGINTLRFTPENSSLLPFYWPFICWRTTIEDKNRTTYYQQQAERQQALNNSNTLETFLTNLNLQVNSYPLDEKSLARLKQLLLRTNQFNMTKIKQVGQNQCQLFDVSDRFGDYGTVGAILYRYTVQHLIIDNIVLSCRVLQRNVELYILRKIITLSQQHQLKNITILFKHTQRNVPAKKFLESLLPSSISEENDSKCYHYTLSELSRLEKSTIFLNHNSFTVQNANTISSTDSNKANAIDAFTHLQQSIQSTLADNSVDNQLSDENAVASFIQAQLHQMTQVTLPPDTNILTAIDSLQATQLIAKIVEWNGAHIKLFDIYEYPTINAFAKQVVSKIPLTTVASQKNPIESEGPATALQEWLWIQNNISKGSWYYNMPFYFKIEGELDIDQLQNAFNMLIVNHASLRTWFDQQDGQIRQRVIPQSKLIIEKFDSHHLNDEELNAQLDQYSLSIIPLDKPPLMKVGLFRCNSQTHILSLVIHHIIADGWSFPLIHKELKHHYNSNKSNSVLHKGESQIQIAKRDQQQQNELSHKEIQYWANELASIKPIQLATPKKAIYQPFIGKYRPIELGADISSRINAYCQSINTTPFEYFLSCYAWFIYQQTNVDDFVILTPISGRDRGDINETIGCFVNLLPIHYRINENYSLQQLFSQTKRQFKQALQHSHICFQSLLSALFKINEKFGSKNMFQIMLSYQKIELFNLQLKNLNISSYRRGYNAARLDLILELDCNSTFSGVVGGYYYNTSKYSAHEIQNYIECYHKIISNSLQPSCETIGA